MPKLINSNSKVTTSSSSFRHFKGILTPNCVLLVWVQPFTRAFFGGFGNPPGDPLWMPWWGNPFLGTKNRYETPGVLPRASNGLLPSRLSFFWAIPPYQPSLATIGLWEEIKISRLYHLYHLYPLLLQWVSLQSHSWNPSKSMLRCLQRFGGSFSTFSKRKELPMKKEGVCFHYIPPRLGKQKIMSP